MTTLRPIDAAILAAFVLVTVGVGFMISGRASKNLRSYFLGGNSIPWYLLGVSNASGMFDISGTMLMVTWLYYGLKSVWIPWLWPVFNQIVMMVYLSVWLRRSGVLTGADWIRLRFGSSRGAQAAHLVVVLFALINVVGFLAYGFIGVGKFAATFLPWQLAADPGTNANLVRGQGGDVQRGFHGGFAVCGDDRRLHRRRNPGDGQGLARDAGRDCSCRLA